MSERIYNVLFLCTGNSARSILAESILRKDGHRHFRAFSAGSQPKGAVNPLAIRVLESLDYPTDDLRSKKMCIRDRVIEIGGNGTDVGHGSRAAA